MVKVVQCGRYSVYVYAEHGQPHHLPHCHVYWGDGDCVVDLRRLLVLDGDDLPVRGRALVREHVDEIRRAWIRLNPEKPAT